MLVFARRLQAIREFLDENEPYDIISFLVITVTPANLYERHDGNIISRQINRRKKLGSLTLANHKICVCDTPWNWLWRPVTLCACVNITVIFWSKFFLYKPLNILSTSFIQSLLNLPNKNRVSYFAWASNRFTTRFD